MGHPFLGHRGVETASPGHRPADAGDTLANLEGPLPQGGDTLAAEAGQPGPHLVDFGSQGPPDRSFIQPVAVAF